MNERLKRCRTLRFDVGKVALRDILGSAMAVGNPAHVIPLAVEKR